MLGNLDVQRCRVQVHQAQGEFSQARQSGVYLGVLMLGPQFARFVDERLDILGKASTVILTHAWTQFLKMLVLLAGVAVCLLYV